MAVIEILAIACLITGVEMAVVFALIELFFVIPRV